MKLAKLSILFLTVGFAIITLIFSWQTSLAQKKIAHPLDPLTGAEIKAAVAVIKKQKKLTNAARYANISLQEPQKIEVQEFKADRPFKREAFVVALEPRLNKTYEAIVDLKTLKLNSWQEIPGVQPPLIDDDYELVEKVAKTDPRWQEAMKKRGITNFDDVAVEAWAAGNLSEKERQSGDRLSRGLSYYKGKNQNYYSSPIEGVLITINLNTRKVVDFIDTGIVPIPKTPWELNEQAVGKLRTAPKMLKIQQPQGRSFQIKGNEISWQKWKFRYMMHPREGLVLYLVSYEDRGIRPILYRASLSEMAVPYADSDPTWEFRNAFDVGEYQMGQLTNSLDLGEEVPENAILLDAVFADNMGEPYVQERAVAIYEQDGGILWKHYDSVSEQKQVRRARNLVITFNSAIGNYDYGFSWVFHQDGTLEMQTELTGIMLAKAVADTERDRFGHRVAKNIVAPHHQHFFTFRLDTDVDGQANSATEMNTNPLPVGQENPRGNAFVMAETLMKSETDAMRDLDMKQHRTWKIVNTQKQNALGGAVGYALLPGENSLLFAADRSAVSQRNGFTHHHFWVTQYKPSEMYAGGSYPNQGKPGQGLSQWVLDNEPIVGKDLVVWYTMGITHIPRPEEWPVMSVHKAGFKLVPAGFFTKNPALDVPSPKMKKQQA